MYGVTQNEAVLPGPGPGAREASRLWLLVGTLIAVLALRLTPNRVHFTTENEPQSALLSNYMVDTDFLARCAARHEGLIGHTDLLAPEIRFAVLQLAANQTTTQ